MTEAGSSKQAQTASSSRLSIYDGPAAPVLLVPEAPSALQLQISSVRKAAQSAYGNLSQRARLASDQWIGAEHKLEHELGTLRARDEPLTPGAFYVGISTLFGSILTRNKMLPLRIVTPPTFLVASAAYFLPRHFSNITAYTASLEQTHTPALYNAQVRLLNTFGHLRSKAAEFASRGAQSTQNAASRVAPWMQAQTGLNISQSEAIKSRDES